MKSKIGENNYECGKKMDNRGYLQHMKFKHPNYQFNPSTKNSSFVEDEIQGMIDGINKLMEKNLERLKDITEIQLCQDRLEREKRILTVTLEQMRKERENQ